MTAVIKWNFLLEQDKMWAKFKVVSVDAYELRLDSGSTVGVAGYHGAANTMSNNDSLGGIARSIAQMQMASNANM